MSRSSKKKKCTNFPIFDTAISLETLLYKTIFPNLRSGPLQREEKEEEKKYINAVEEQLLRVRHECSSGVWWCALRKIFGGRLPNSAPSQNIKNIFSYLKYNLCVQFGSILSTWQILCLKNYIEYEPNWEKET